jgi:hypothetical protein
MRGDDRVRHCGECRLNVYNLSEMTRQEAEDFLHEATGRVCVRFYRRADGTILTQDCPSGLDRFQQRLAAKLWINAAIAWLITGVVLRPLVPGRVFARLVHACAGREVPPPPSSQPLVGSNDGGSVPKELAMGKLAMPSSGGTTGHPAELRSVRQIKVPSAKKAKSHAKKAARRHR